MGRTKIIARIFSIAALFVFTLAVISMAGRPASKDYISYWSAGQLLRQHSNPYSTSAVLAIERTQGYAYAKPIIMRNPPWALFLVYPLGRMSASIGLIAWSTAMIGCIFAFLHLADVAPGDRMLVFCFAPVFGCVAAGQSSAFLLLGFCLFLHFEQRRPFAAGAALLFMAIKPHLFLVYWPILLIDCVYRRRFRVLAGAAVALAAASVYAICLEPHIWSYYSAMLHASQLDMEFFQTPAYLVRLLIDPKAHWLQFAPSFVGIVWAISFYARNRSAWDWRVHGILVMLITILVAPYAWMTDEVVLLPSIIFALSGLRGRGHSSATFMIINGIIIFMLMLEIQLSSGAYIWTSSVWLAWYLFSRRQKDPIVGAKISQDAVPIHAAT